MKKIFALVVIVTTVVMFNLNSKKDIKSDLKLANIHLLEANAEMTGQICYGGSQSGDLFDFCVECDDCIGQFGRKCIGWRGNC